jgi:hypothetical protein
LLAQQHQRQHCRMVQQNSVKMHNNASSIMERRISADSIKFLIEKKVKFIFGPFLFD